jgi:hypothetical protein
MAARGVKEEDIPHKVTSPGKDHVSTRYFETKGLARFECPKQHCGNTWCSEQVWCFIDLKKQTICYRGTQACRNCNTKTSPEFTEESVERMAEFVVSMYFIRTEKRRAVRINDEGKIHGGHHDQKRCERCRRLGYSCWQQSTHTSKSTTW